MAEIIHEFKHSEVMLKGTTDPPEYTIEFFQDLTTAEQFQAVAREMGRLLEIIVDLEWRLQNIVTAVRKPMRKSNGRRMGM